MEVFARLKRLPRTTNELRMKKPGGKMVDSLRRLLLSAVLCTVGALAGGLALAEGTQYQCDLPKERLADALRAVARQTNKNVLFDPALVERISAPALRARLSLDAAMRELLAGTALRVRNLPPDTVVVERARDEPEHGVASV